MKILAPLLFMSLASVATAQDQESFTKSLKSVESKMDRGQWEKASSDLLALLEEHERAEYAYFEKRRILQDMERIALFLKFDPPSADDVIKGEVKKYDAAKGKIEVIFSGKDLSDFEFDQNTVSFPPLFTGPYSIEMKGEDYPANDSLSLFIGWGTDHFWGVFFGDEGHKPTISWIQENDKTEFLETSEKQPMRSGNPFHVLLDVKKSKVTVKADGKKLMSYKRPKDDYGLFFFRGMADYELESLEITIKGEIEPSWVAGLIDEVMQEKRAQFEEDYSAEDVLPAWLFEEAAPAAAPAEPEAKAGGGSLRGRTASRSTSDRAKVEETFRIYPGDSLSSGDMERFNNLRDDIYSRDADVEEIATMIEAFESDDEMPSPASDFLRVELFGTHGNIEAASEAAERMATSCPEHQPSVLLHARLLGRMRDFDSARQVLLEAKKRWPNSGKVVEVMVDNEILDLHLKEAQQMVREAMSQGILGSEGEKMQEQIDKAVSGPHWPKTYRFESKHYDIQSDISEAICKEASHLLESAYRSYSVHLSRIKGLEKTKFRVFLFSGEAGYMRYAEDSFGASRENTAGLYSPYLKQLLIWNVPQREAMFRTIVHEGFHQYLDMVAPGTPRWFNEGMAENMELYETVNGKFTEGQANPQHLELLMQARVPLEHFLKMPAGAFYEGNSMVNYAQGWAFVHFLRNTGREEQKIFDALFKGFENSPSSAQVMEAAFEGVDMEDLEERFVQHIKDLHSKQG